MKSDKAKLLDYLSENSLKIRHYISLDSTPNEIKSALSFVLAELCNHDNQLGVE